MLIANFSETAKTHFETTAGHSLQLNRILRAEREIVARSADGEDRRGLGQTTGDLIR